MSARTWFITGSSRGFGREWAIAALERGDSVAATARDTGSLDDLVERFGDRILPLKLDVTDRAAVFAAVETAHGRFGRLDVVVNNAGYGQFGHDRGDQRGRGAGAVRDERLRRAVGHPGRAADPAGAGIGAHPAGVVDRRDQRVPEHRDLQRVEVGAGGVQPVAGRRRWRVRHQGHADRARRLLHGLGRRRRPSTPHRCPPTTSSASRPPRPRKARVGTRATRWPPARRC